MKDSLPENYFLTADVSKPLSPSVSKVVMQFATRQQARNGAEQIGWRRQDAREVDVMGFRLWTSTSASKVGFAAMNRDR